MAVSTLGERKQCISNYSEAARVCHEWNISLRGVCRGPSFQSGVQTREYDRFRWVDCFSFRHLSGVNAFYWYRAASGESKSGRYKRELFDR